MLFLCKFALRNHHDNSPAMENESRKYWHLCSDELPDNLIFKTVEDFRQGMNSIPIALQGMNIIIFCFTLGTVGKCREFLNKLIDNVMEFSYI